MPITAGHPGPLGLMKTLLETAGLRMHALESSDEALFCELFTDKQAMQFISEPLSAARAARSFRIALRSRIHIAPSQVFLRAVHKSSGEDAGLCSIQDVDLSRRRAELGVILRPARHAQGLGKEALRALVDYAFRLFPIDEAWVQYDSRHTAAERLVISTGFKQHAGEDADIGCSKRTGSVFRQDWSPRIVSNL